MSATTESFLTIYGNASTSVAFFLPRNFRFKRRIRERDTKTIEMVPRVNPSFFADVLASPAIRWELVFFVLPESTITTSILSGLFGAGILTFFFIKFAEFPQCFAFLPYRFPAQCRLPPLAF